VVLLVAVVVNMATTVQFLVGLLDLVDLLDQMVEETLLALEVTTEVVEVEERNPINGLVMVLVVLLRSFGDLVDHTHPTINNVYKYFGG
jgi:c-di-GMP-related signal transduction protein